MLNRLKARYALRWTKYVDLDDLEAHIKALRTRKELDCFFKRVSKKMIEVFYKGGNNA